MSNIHQAPKSVTPIGAQRSEWRSDLVSSNPREALLKHANDSTHHISLTMSELHPALTRIVALLFFLAGIWLCARIL